MAAKPDISLLGFAFSEYERRGWAMPAVHTRIFDWLARTEGARNRVLMVFRGCGKSTILGVRNAHKYRANPAHQLLVQGADDDLADDISRDTISIMRGNPLVGPILAEPAGIRHWFTVQGFEANARTPQYRGRGILSRVTGNRADEIINDDTEMSKNVETPEARGKLRKRLSEQSFILKPGGSVLWVGTPHTHDSIYEQKIKGGAEALVIPLFEHQTRYEAGDKPRRELAFTGKPGPDGVWVFVGIGKDARLLSDREYTVKGQTVTLAKPTAGLVDVCVGNAWPERFDRKEMDARRKECETVNYWDQQYMLQAKPLSASRLNPDLIEPYDCEPTFTRRNRQLVMLLGQAQIVGAACRWDPSAAKVNSDVSALSVVLFDQAGNRYWHRAVSLTGEVAEFDKLTGKTIIGGQVHQIVQVVRELQLRRVVVETNGAGTFGPQILLTALKQAGLACGVTGLHETRNKNKTILEAFEGPMSSGKMWAHVDVLAAVSEQMRDWKPDVTTQPDDYLDSAAKALIDQPERVGHLVGTSTAPDREDWRPSAGVFEAELHL